MEDGSVAATGKGRMMIKEEGALSGTVVSAQGFKCFPGRFFQVGGQTFFHKRRKPRD